MSENKQFFPVKDGVKCVCPYCRKSFVWPPADMRCPGCAKTVRPPPGFALPGKEERRKKIAKIQKDFNKKSEALGTAPNFKPSRNPTVILGVLAAFVVIGGLFGALSMQKDEPGTSVKKDPFARTVDEMKYYATALEHYRLDIGNYPLANRDGGMRALVEDPGEPAWSGPYAARIKKDWWGKEYFYDCTNGVPVLVSAGPDEMFNTDDDIVADADWFKPHPGFKANDPVRKEARPAAPVKIN